MTKQEYVNKQVRFYNELITKGKPFEISVYNVVAKQVVRIFENGQNSAGGNIGQYNSTDPMYVNKKYIRGGGKLGVPKGKTGKSKFKNGNPHKLNYVNSYKDLRNRLGKRIDRVNLVFNNDLFSDFANAQVIGKVKPNKINALWYTTSFKRDINEKKREGLEKKYGTIFNLTKEELELFYKSVDFNIRKAYAEFK